MSVQGPVFIVTTGRSGSTTIACMLSTISNCVCLHEPYPQLILESTGYRYGEKTETDLIKILTQSRSALTQKSLYCESNQILSLIIPVLIKAFPSCKFIWLIRNGLDFVSSAMQKQWYTGHSENHTNYADCPEIEKQWIDGRIIGDRCGDVPSKKWKNMNRFERICWYWSYINSLIAHDLNKYASNRYKVLLLEKLTEQFKDILNWLRLKYFIEPLPKQFNAAKNSPYSCINWSREEIERFDYWCGILMDEFYPSWRTNENKCSSTKPSYRPNLVFSESIRSNYKIVKKINAIFSRNLRN